VSSEYQLAFKTSALKEWKKLAEPLKKQFKKKLAERLEAPRVPADALSGFMIATRSSSEALGTGSSMKLRTRG